MLNILKTPNNIFFINNALKMNRPLAELIDNLLIIKDNAKALEFVSNNPKTLGALMRLNKGDLNEILKNFSNEVFHKFVTANPLQILKAAKVILDNNNAQTEQGDNLIAMENMEDLAPISAPNLGKRGSSDDQLESNKVARLDQDANSYVFDAEITITNSVQSFITPFIEHNIIQNHKSPSFYITFPSSKTEFNAAPSIASINKLAIASYAIKEAFESLPTVTSFFKIYDLDLSWLNNFSKEIHLTASYVGSLALGEIDPSAALFSNTLYQVKQEIRENLYQSYNHDLDKAIASPIDFVSKCSNYMFDQTLVNIANSDLSGFTAISATSSLMVSGVECYTLYNNHNSVQNDNTLANYVIYPVILISSFASMDFSNNFNAMQSCKQGISTLSSIVMLDQLIGMISPIIENQ